MDRWMNGWMDELTNGWIDEWIDGQMYEQTDQLILSLQAGMTSLDVAQANSDDEAKEALLRGRFSSEEVETDFLQERLPQLIEKTLVSSLLILTLVTLLFFGLQSSKNDEKEKEHALLCLRAEIRVATSSMTSVPKPLKILREHFDQLKEAFENIVSQYLYESHQS